MLEELLDLVAVGGGASLGVTGGGVHQQSHGALQLLLPLLPLRLCQPHLQLIDAPHLGLHHMSPLISVTGLPADAGCLLGACQPSSKRQTCRRCSSYATARQRRQAGRWSHAKQALAKQACMHAAADW